MIQLSDGIPNDRPNSLGRQGSTTAPPRSHGQYDSTASKRATQDTPHQAQFRLWALLEFVTLCGVIMALSAVTGAVAGFCLILMALALWTRQGWLALAMLMMALLAADAAFYPLPGTPSLTSQLAVILMAAGLCGWYRYRRAFCRRG
jgi:hypothetical protein